MNKIISSVSVLILLAITSCSGINKPPVDRELDFNLNWNFYKTNDNINVKDLNVDEWRLLNLPHDWLVEAEFDKNLKKDAIGTGYLAGELYGFYKKTFDKPYNEDEVTTILFDGVYNNSEVWVNGNKLGFHPYGYSPFYYDVTKYLNKDGKNNEVIVKIDHSRFADSRWYSGAGIYRNVKLITTNKLNIPVWGTFVTTPEVSKSKATVKLNINVENRFDAKTKIDLKTVIVDDNAVEVAVTTTASEIASNATNTITQNLEVKNPKLWNTRNPKLYKAITSIVKEGKVVDQYETPFGIRKVKFDVNKGFFLNGENMKIKGVCLHHDGGIVGAAVPKGVWKRRLQILKDGGCNAIRISHNPASNEFLELCDEMGMMVQDEFFDEWDNPKDKRYNQNENKSKDYITRGYGEHFQKWAETDLKSTLKSHRNHPSVIQWSIGNEIEWTYPKNAASTGYFNNISWTGGYFWSEPPFSVERIKRNLDSIPSGKYDIGKTAQKLSRWTKELDTTRPVVANCILPSSSHLSGYADALDIVGYSYRRVLYDYGHKNYPNKVIMGTENLAQYHEWKAIMERPFISGTFLWTGIDYMGEIRDPWPVRVQPSGLLTTAAFKKGSYHMMKTLWNNEPHLKITTQNIEKSLYKMNAENKIVAKDPEKWKHALWKWQEENNHWSYKDNEMIAVAMYSNCEEIELFLNDKSLGKRKLSDFADHIYKWGVPFAKGKLVAKGIKDGKEITSEIITEGKATSIELTVDEKELSANNYDVAHIEAQLKDSNGNLVFLDNKKITFEIIGEAKLLGVDSGWKKSVEKLQSNKSTTHEGKTLLIIQAKDKAGDVKIVAKADGLESASIQIQIK